MDHYYLQIFKGKMNYTAYRKSRDLKRELNLETLHQVLHLINSQMRHKMSKNMLSELLMKKLLLLFKHMIWYHFHHTFPLSYIFISTKTGYNLLNLFSSGGCSHSTT